MPLIATRGAASAQGFGEFAQSAANYIEDVFSTYVYAGNSTSGGTQTITNNIDLSTKGGMVWIKGRNAASEHILTDTSRGAGSSKTLSSSLTNAQGLGSSYDYLSAFNTTGFSVTQAGTVTSTRATNYTGVNYVGWTFREQAKFFDVVTYTGTGVARTVAHNLGSVPGCIITKRTDTAGNWNVYHRSTGNTKALYLNLTNASTTDTVWNNTTPTSTEFTVSSDSNTNGGTYVAYLFAHDAGGFGVSGTDNVISCGSFTVSGTTTVTLNYEPQYVMLKRTDQTSDWLIVDSMRGFVMSANNNTLSANTSAVETSTSSIAPSSTGFTIPSGFLPASSTWIYIAIRRGPMKTPTLGTTVFGLNARSGTSSNATVTGGQIADHFFVKNRGLAIAGLWTSRLVGADYAEPSSTAAFTPSGATQLQANPWDVMDGVKVGTTGNQTNSNSYTYINYLFQRAPGFFDVVGYTGTTSARTVNHNLGSVPEIIIVKERSGASTWAVYNSAGGNTSSLFLDSTNSYSTAISYWNSTTPTSSVFSLGTGNPVNANGSTYIAYLFATLSGVSKVGSYTGTGTTQQVNCGFTSGARFILIKRTDSTGDWYYWDTARGIVAGNDPYLLLNSTNAEVTSTDYVDTFSSGFELSSTAPASLNEAPGITWVSRTSGFGATAVRDVVYGNGLYIAVGDSGKLTTSTDSITWTSRTSGFGADSIYDVAYGNNLFVAVGGAGKLFTSSDGITWTSRTSNFGADDIFGVAYGNNLFVAVGANGKLSTSSDGITWTSRTSGFSSDSINCVTFGNNLFVIAGGAGKLSTSTDGITWTSRTSGFSTDIINGLTYGNNLYVAVGANGKLTTSTDATTWTSRTSGFSTTTINDVAFGNGTFVAVGANATMTTSTDGTTWTSRTSNFGAATIIGVGYGNSIFVAVGTAGTMTTNNPNYIFLAIA